jgi:hypothetical protein
MIRVKPLVHILELVRQRFPSLLWRHFCVSALAHEESCQLTSQREWENRNRELNEARDALEVYKNYKPDVNIVYHDEFGLAAIRSNSRWA